MPSHRSSPWPNFSAMPDPYVPEPDVYHSLPLRDDAMHDKRQPQISHRQMDTQARSESDDHHHAKDETRAPVIHKVTPGVETLAADVSCLAVPLGLLGFAIAVLCHDGREATPEAIAKWVNAASILSTLFPVMFAAIVGRLMVQVARYRLEQGSTLGTLEQLLGSRTVGGAVLSPFHLQGVNPLTVGLLLLWVFSPLGAQSVLRMLLPQLSSRVQDSAVQYFDTRAKSLLSDYTAASAGSAISSQVAIDLFGTIYTSLLLAPRVVKNDTMDLWGNVKIPLLPASASSSSSSSSSSSWWELEQGDIPNYSAMVGIPLLNVSEGNTSFTLESSYMSLECEDFRTYTWNDTREEVNSSVIQAWVFRPYNTIPNGTFQGYPMSRNISGKLDPAPWSLSVDRLVDSGWANGSWIHRDSVPEEEEWAYVDRVQDSPAFMFEHDEDVAFGPARLYFEAQPSNQALLGNDIISSYCDIEQHYVESRVTCARPPSDNRPSCRVTAQRASQKPHPPSTITPLSFPQVLQAFAKNMPLATGPNAGDVSNADITLQYMADPALRNLTLPGSGNAVRLQDTQRADFSQRFTEVLNSYLHVAQMFTNALGNEDPDGRRLSSNVTAPAEVETLVLEYHVRKEWAALCILACCVLLAAGVAGVVYAHVSVGPEILGFASTVVRDSKLVDMPVGAGARDGLDLTVEMKQRRIRYGLTRRDGDLEPLLGVGEEDGTVKIGDLVRGT
ncbi:uncharacterized protein J7T54_002991 [Emericellopsis cladophorae]|uniref:Uncharacterized protein n=1 Tax=Emericellopsis cladophorae TaxID=2686198 RepID=A0A9Q0BBX1_9HYPO|nr:uncharacterized protein J7T54_002991 [Emericellopsis cladophorae]KAI6780212.1 hypothetical protein J7T54_002991 [Emericellopsis cladophorae]